MFEFEQFDRNVLGRVIHPSLDTSLQKQHGPERIQSFSLQSWGEHCTECAFPACYTTCSFYRPRQDGRCRRFVFGIYPTASPRSWMPFSAFVQFKNWSQLWTQGNATQLPQGVSKLLALAGATAWTTSSPLDWLLQKATGRKRLSLLLQSLRRRTIRLISGQYARFPKPDGLLIEIFNPMPVTVQLQLRVRGHEKRARFEWTDRAAAGFSSFLVPVAEMEKWIDLSRPFEMFLTIAEEEGKSLYFCSATFVRLVSKRATQEIMPKPAAARKIKCVVWDLDHTLWDGILVERGETGVQLKDGIRSVLKELDRRGILLSIASKNAEEDARKVLESLGIWEMFLAPQIHWQPKSGSIQQIAKRLNLGLDAFAFVDDQPFERDEVVKVLPMVTIVPAEQALTLLGRPEFAGDTSGEGSSRRLMYQTEIRREEDMSKTGLDYDAFLAACEIKVRVQRPGEELLPRIHDIIQRTNQLNIATQRYEMEELRPLLHDGVHQSFIVSGGDKYGEYGHVEFIVVARAENRILIRDCMFSCRVQGKGIDEAVLVHLINHFLQSGVTDVRARFMPTKRNAPAGEMLARVGFQAQPGMDGELAIVPPAVRPAVAHVQIESDLGVGQ